MKFRPSLAVVLICICLSACDNKDEVKVYRLTKEDSQAAAPQPEMPPDHAGMGGGGGAPMMGGGMGAPMMGDMSGAVPMAGDPHGGMQPRMFSDSAPKDWQAQPLSPMRQASYLVKGENGAQADVSIIVMGGAAGGDLDNVNRWLAQLGQSPMTAEQLAQKAQRVTSQLGEVTVVDLEGLAQGADASKDGRILAGMASGEGMTVFFKMRGNAALTKSQKDAFLNWIGTVKPAEETANAVEAAAPSTPAVPEVPAMANSDAKIQWNVPSGWKSVPASSMRYASFSAGKNGESADISVSSLGGAAGGDLGNVNRWRGQIGLGPVGDAELKPLVVPVKGNGCEFLTVDMNGPKGRVLAAWATVGANTWFFKLTGPEKVAAEEKAAFVKFLESVRFQP